MTPEEFRLHGHRIVDLIADYRARVADLPVSTPREPGAVRAQLAASPPEGPEPFDAILRDVEEVVMPALAHWQHPRFFGFFPSNGELSSVLGDYLSTGLGVLGLSWAASPPLTEVEELVTDWMRELVGLAPGWSGVIQDTASTSTLLALCCARERTTSYSLARGGLQAEARPLRVYVSDQAHSSVEKAALLAGFGRDNVVRVPVDGAYALRADLLREAVERDLERGAAPCAVVATSGTTATTAFDPLDACADVAREHGLWLHVDAAMAGSAMVCPEMRGLWRGVEGADSLVLNPHKWLGAAFDCSLYYVRDPEHLVRVSSTNPSYLASSADGRVRNYRDWGIALGRRFRALKLWFLIREQGAEALRARIRRDVANARALEAEVRATPRWRVLAPVALQTVCVRHEPDGLEGEALDRHTLGWCERLNRSGEAWLTPALLDGRWMVRVSIGALGTEREHVEQLWRAMRAEVEVVLPATTAHADGSSPASVDRAPVADPEPRSAPVRATASFADVLGGFEHASSGDPGENSAWLSLATGEVHLTSGVLGLEDDFDPDDFPEPLLALPHRHDLDLGRNLALEFVAERMPQDLGRVERMFSRSGAYGHFKDWLEERGRLEAWFDYEREQTEGRLRRWCAEHDVGLTEDP